MALCVLACGGKADNKGPAEKKPPAKPLVPPPQASSDTAARVAKVLGADYPVQKLKKKRGWGQVEVRLMRP